MIAWSWALLDMMAVIVLLELVVVGVILSALLFYVLWRCGVFPES